jgi:hypothetical protein
VITKDTKLLVICPSRSRPEKLKRMLESFYRTKSEGTEIVIYVSDDDPLLEDYKPILEKENHVIGPRKTIVEVDNYFSCEVYPNIPYYGEINDDHVYSTFEWDKKLIQIIESCGGGWGLACGNDTVHKNWHGVKHPSGAIISGNIVRTLKCFILPGLRHLGCDGYLRDLTEGVERLFYVPEVIIEHHHFVNKKADFNNDPNYKHIYTKEQIEHADKVLSRWHEKKKADDIIRLKNAMEKKDA